MSHTLQAAIIRMNCESGRCPVSATCIQTDLPCLHPPTNGLQTCAHISKRNSLAVGCRLLPDTTRTSTRTGSLEPQRRVPSCACKIRIWSSLSGSGRARMVSCVDAKEPGSVSLVAVAGWITDNSKSSTIYARRIVFPTRSSFWALRAPLPGINAR